MRALSLNPDPSNANPTFDLVNGSSVQTTAMNVAVAGIAPAVDVFNSDRAVDIGPQTELFVALTAREAGGFWRFAFVPMTSGTIEHASTPHAKELLQRVVGAWRLGTVVDTAAAVGGWDTPQHARQSDDGWRDHWQGDESVPGEPPKLTKSSHERRVTINVVVEWVGWRGLRAKFSPDYWTIKDQGVGSLALQELAKAGALERGCPTVGFNWPSAFAGGAGDAPVVGDLDLVVDSDPKSGDSEAAATARWLQNNAGSVWFKDHYEPRELEGA